MLQKAISVQLFLVLITLLYPAYDYVQLDGRNVVSRRYVLEDGAQTPHKPCMRQMSLPADEVLGRYEYSDENSALTDAELHTQTQPSRTSFPQSERRGQHDEEHETTNAGYSETRQEDLSQPPAWDAVRDELESDRQLLESLIGALRVAHPQQIRSLVNLLRSNVPRHDIQAYLDESFEGLDPILQLDASTRVGEVDDSVPSPRKHRYRTGRIQDLMNPPLAVPAKPWTTVTDNDDFVSHLMSLWFTWAHSWWQWVDEALFLEAMKAGDSNSPFCTPYLVNMILADACLLDYMGPNEIEPNLDLREQFYTEGKRQLEMEKGEISLALVQAMGVQWT
ncbi:hypothetical protein H2198_007812 [Neophaeococcomyces mojaviensis]|uniref:Uncharacterized protein n=1 Tax=Neophaeococcomyces mojaviensis TaxID=3383035 RepID=A0ACC2ZZ25_9EURO|nr:hypothetical protein H2198_007812 [Knufia sp. JES_112]